MLESQETFKILEIINSHGREQFLSLSFFCSFFFFYGDIENKEVFVS